MEDVEGVKARLRKEHETFRELEDQHHHLEKQIGKLNKRHVLTTEEEMQKKHLQKEKLRIKDQMEAMIREFGKTGKATLSH
jgi:uncharacterized protein YdcH (DUF465 family)